MNLAFFSSYNGSSAQAITDASLAGEISASPTLLITNNDNANALSWAENKGLRTVCINSKTHSDTQERDSAIAEALQNYRINMVILSGYMQLIGPETISAVKGRMINIHPSLLPKYGGKGMYGSNVHQAVKENNEHETGITIHQVSTKYDEGKILAQKIIPISSEDSAQDIEHKVRLEEPDFYVETLRKILRGEIELD